MHIFVLILWIVSLVLLAFEPARTRPFQPWGLGLFFFDLWLGLHFLIETTDPITF
jgi:hypothetical protein